MIGPPIQVSLLRNFHPRYLNHGGHTDDDPHYTHVYDNLKETPPTALMTQPTITLRHHVGGVQCSGCSYVTYHR